VSVVRYIQDDGTSGEVRVTGRDKIAWEDSTGGAWYDSPLTHRQLSWVAGHAAVRAGLFESVQQFLDGNSDVVPVAGESDPTQPAATGGPSSS
jgi:hypothetical protein